MGMTHPSHRNRPRFFDGVRSRGVSPAASAGERVGVLDEPRRRAARAGSVYFARPSWCARSAELPNARSDVTLPWSLKTTRVAWS